MEQLHPVAQTVTVIMIGLCFCVAILALFTTYFDK